MMEPLDIFNIIAGAASIVGLIVSVVVASKIIKLTKSNNDNKGQIQQGDGEQNVAGNHSVIGDGKMIHIDYSNSEIYGEIDNYPVLTDEKYFIYNDNYDKYSLGISQNTINMLDTGKKDTFILLPDFTNVISSPNDVRFIGYSFKSLPMRDWRSFILKNFCLSFTYSCMDNIKEMWIEITSLSQNIKLYKQKLNLSKDRKRFLLPLNNFSNMIENWKKVDEICFVFFPEDCIGQRGTVCIMDIEILKL